MDFILQTTEWQGIIWALLAFVMIKELRAHGKEIFDDQVTPFDKDRLLRLSYTFVYPVVVLFHESGHALATILCGGVVKEFHYGFWIGYVVPVGNFTALQDLYITLAGNVVQIIIGFVFLLFAFLARSPAMVALWIYSAIIAIAGTVIAYTMLSVLTGQGDWAMIYRTPEKEAFGIVLVCHIILAAFTIYIVNGKAPKLWFFKRINPAWCVKLKELELDLAQNPSTEAYLRLAAHYAQARDFKSARKCFDAIPESERDFRVLFLMAYVEDQENFPSKALELCQKILDTSDDPLIQSQALCLYAGVLPKIPNQENPLANARKYLDKAITLAPGYGDPLFYMVMNMIQARDFDAAQSLLERLNKDADNLSWSNPGLMDEVLPELNALKSMRKQKR
ncbi:M50 family metallopeptidase [bacterium]|nr:M50 family metallopeptidase [bacterium]